MANNAAPLAFATSAGKNTVAPPAGGGGSAAPASKSIGGGLRKG